MLKGGYKIIDLENKNHEVGVGMVHEGIYDAIEGTNKVILLSGLVFEGTELHDVFVFPSVSGTAFVFPMTVVSSDATHTVLVTVEDTDVVTVTFTD